MMTVVGAASDSLVDAASRYRVSMVRNDVTPEGHAAVSAMAMSFAGTNYLVTV